MGMEVSPVKARTGLYCSLLVFAAPSTQRINDNNKNDWLNEYGWFSDEEAKTPRCKYILKVS